MWLLFWLLFWFLLFVVGACLIFLIPTLWGREIYKHYRGSRAAMCPATHRQVAVSFDAFHAALTGLRGKFELRLAGCTLWPARVPLRPGMYSAGPANGAVHPRRD